MVYALALDNIVVVSTKGTHPAQMQCRAEVQQPRQLSGVQRPRESREEPSGM